MVDLINIYKNSNPETFKIKRNEYLKKEKEKDDSYFDMNPVSWTK